MTRTKTWTLTDGGMALVMAISAVHLAEAAEEGDAGSVTAHPDQITLD
jgi:hypothetical protein